MRKKENKMRSNLLPIAKEGWRYVACALALHILFYMVGFSTLSFLAFLVLIFFIFVFRNPEREISLFESGSVLSPADGVVVGIEEDEISDEYVVSIESGCFDVALLRSPIDADSIEVKETKGAQLFSNSKLFDKLAQRVEIVFGSKSGDTLKVEHLQKQTISPVSVDLASSIKQGSRYGYMLNGLTRVRIKRSSRLSVVLGSKVEAGVTLLGYFAK